MSQKKLLKTESKLDEESEFSTRYLHNLIYIFQLSSMLNSVKFQDQHKVKIKVDLNFLSKLSKFKAKAQLNVELVQSKFQKK